MPKLYIVTAKFGTVTNNTWLGLRPYDKYTQFKRRVVEFSNKVFNKEKCSSVTDACTQKVFKPVRQSLLAKQNFQSTLKHTDRYQFRPFFNTSVFGKGFISKRLKYSHILAFSTLLLAKEDAFEKFEEEETRISIYSKVCRNLKDILKTTPSSESSEDLENCSIKDFDIKELIAVGSNGVVFEASKRKNAVQNVSSKDKTITIENCIPPVVPTMAIKMVYNLRSSNFFSIYQMVESELVVSKGRMLGGAAQWQIKKHSRMKVLPLHTNILHIEAAIIDKVPLNLPGQSDYCVLMPWTTPCGKGARTTMFLVSKRYPYTLQQVIKRGLCEAEKQLLCLQLLQGTAHLERHFLVHRDLKSENIFVEYDESCLPRLVIGDFGCSLQGNTHEDLVVPFYHDIRDGTACIQAPEIRNATAGRGNSIDYRSSDLWCVGGLLCEILYGTNPLMDEDFVIPESKNLPYCWKWLIEELLNKNRECRPSAVLASNIIYLDMFGPKQHKPTDQVIVDWLQMHAAEYIVYKHEKWGLDSVMCDLFSNFLSNVSSDHLNHALKIWSKLV